MSEEKRTIGGRDSKVSVSEAQTSQDMGGGSGDKALVDQSESIMAPAEGKKFPKKAILFGGIGVVVLAVLIGIFSLAFRGGGGKAGSNYALYLKDSEIFFTDLKKNSKAWQLTTRLSNFGDVENYGLSQTGYYLGRFTYVSQDGKYIFFPDKVDDVYDGGINLYYKEIAKPDGDAVKIDSNIRSYTVNTSAAVVTYLKGSEGNLYQYKVGKDSKDKIASEVRNYQVSDDGKKIVYRNSEGNIYLQDGDKDKEKVASNVSALQRVTKDFTTFYYTKEEALYKQVIGQDKEKIASDVYSVLKVYDSGEAYYLTRDSSSRSIMDYVVDDMKEADAAITQPDYPEYPNYPDSPSWWDYDTDEEYEAAYEAYQIACEKYDEECNRLYAEYEAANEDYWAKYSRDELRESLQYETFDQSSYSLCYFNGKEETILTDAFAYNDYTMADDAPVIIYKVYDQSSFDKVKLSEINSIYDVEYLMKNAMNASSSRYLAVKGAPAPLEQEKEARCFRINPSGTTVYYIDEISDEKNYGELYCISISGGSAGKPEAYDSEVYAESCYFASDRDFVYFKDYTGNKGELYINKDRIDYEVNAFSVNVDSDQNRVVYLTDWDIEKECGVLKVYQGKEAVKVADEVHSYAVIPDGRVVYLYDYNTRYYSGELHEWSNGETRKIDDDVAYLCSISNDKYRGIT